MAEPKVWVFCYGSFINRQVLARGGLVPDQVEVAWLSGFDIRIETLATLVRSDRDGVYGAFAADKACWAIYYATVRASGRKPAGGDVV